MSVLSSATFVCEFAVPDPPTPTGFASVVESCPRIRTAMSTFSESIRAL
jgi:hypothetical protein